MTKEQAKADAIELATRKFYSTPIICLINGEWIPAAHFEGRYLTSYKPMSEAQEMETCNIYEEPRVWELEPVGMGAMLKDLLSALPRDGE